MDLEISRWIVDIFGDSKFFAYTSRFLTYLGSYGSIIIMLVLLFTFKKTRKFSIYLAAAIAIVYSINGFILKPLIARDRPFVVDENLKRMCELSGYDFPDGYSMTSGHACVTMAIAVTTMMFFKKKWAIAGFAYPIVVGLTRVTLCVHFLTDVIAGWALGAVLAVGIYYLSVFVDKKITEKLEKRKQL